MGFTELADCIVNGCTAAISASPVALAAIGIFVSIYVAGWLIARALCRVSKHMNPQQKTAIIWTRSMIRLAFFLLAVISTLGYLGVDLSALIAGLGLTGFALGFALKDILSNTLSGILIVIYRPFKLRDRIVVGTASGVVCTMDLRYTVLKNDQDERFYIPNATLFSQIIKKSPAPASEQNAV